MREVSRPVQRVVNDLRKASRNCPVITSCKRRRRTAKHASPSAEFLVRYGPTALELGITGTATAPEPITG